MPTDWQAFGSNSNAAWERSDTIGAYGSNSGCAFFDNFSTNLAGNFYGMRTVSFDLTNAVLPTMKFDVAYAQRDAGTTDRLGVWYSFNGTTGWMNLQNYQGKDLATTAEQSNYFVPQADQWDSITIDLTQFAGEDFIRFAFENNSSFGNVIYIDNVRFYDEQFVGINSKNTQVLEFSFYPNPLKNNILNVDSKGYVIDELQLMDQLGKLYQIEYDQNQNSISVDLTRFADGIYTIIATVKGQPNQVERIILR